MEENISAVFDVSMTVERAPTCGGPEEAAEDGGERERRGSDCTYSMCSMRCAVHFNESVLCNVQYALKYIVHQCALQCGVL